MKDGRPRCRCRVWSGGTGPQCGNPAKNDGICGTHWCVVERGSLPIAGFYDEPRPRIWGEELNGNFHQVPEGAKAGDTIPWKSNATQTREDTPEPCEAGDTSVKDMDHLVNAAALTQAQERLHELGVPRMSATEKVDEEWDEAEKAFADMEAELDAQLATIASRNEKRGLALDKEFFRMSVETEKVAKKENTKTVVYVSLGDEVEARSNRPSGSKLHNRIHIHYNDGSTEEKGTGWLTFMREGDWYHLGGDKDKPILYKIDLTKKNRWNRRGIDKDLAHSLYHSMGFNKS